MRSKTTKKVEKLLSEEQGRFKPTAIYKCGRCLFEKHVRADLIPVQLMCAHCEKPIRPRIVREQK